MAVQPTAADATYRKVAWRLMPLILLCYVANYIDRTNIGIAQLVLRTDLGFSAQVYGIGVGLFFVGFVLFEIPSNILLDRIGARRTLLRIMVGWGAVSALTMFVRTPVEFYVARILLGMAEAGFFPGILLYLTYWFPSARRTRMTAVFFLGLPLSGIVGAPLSGWILHAFAGVGGLRGWQWLFMLEGIPSVLLGIAVFFLLQDRPADAAWLTADDARRMVPILEVGDVLGCTFCPSDGIASPASVGMGYAAAARRHGARLREGVEVTAINEIGRAHV